LISRPGPRIVDGLEQMARALHPESFKWFLMQSGRERKKIAHR
jgi:hypothetical protein